MNLVALVKYDMRLEYVFLRVVTRRSSTMTLRAVQLRLLATGDDNYGMDLRLRYAYHMLVCEPLFTGEWL
jgi:hypothetical protein